MTTLFWTFGHCTLRLPALTFFESFTPEEQEIMSADLGPPPYPDAWVEIETRGSVRVIRWARPDQETEPP